MRSKTTRNFKITLAYDGTGYGGWQRQPNTTSVQQVIEQALTSFGGGPVTLHGSGRTDAGVHARGQVASCALKTALPACTIQRALNAKLPDDIRVLGVQEAAKGFHARFSAKGKEYRYQLDVGEVADPFLLRYAWHHPQPLDLTAMRRAAGVLKGRHDFAAVSANPMRPVDSTVRTIRKLTITQRGQVLTVSVTADGFLYKMVRTIVGALVKVGEGKLAPHELKRLMESKRRVAIVETAPARGLFLWKVRY
jgi:tRNA pseudouridine38-40 synthase